MGKRYPGAPNDAGDMHPLIHAVMHADMPHTLATFQALSDVAEMVRLSQDERRTFDEDEDDFNLADYPAYDRLTDLAILGLLVERQKFFLTAPEVAELAMEPCQNFTGGATCLDNDSGRTFDGEDGTATQYCWPCRLRHAMGGHLVAAHIN